MTRFICAIFMTMILVFTINNVSLAGQKGESGRERCSMKPEGGPCKALFHKYYFDEKSGQCRSFVWGGCQGVVPFETLEECRKTCAETGVLQITDITALKNRVYAQISLEYPGLWKNPVFSVEIDGRPVQVRSGWGGSSGERRMEGLLFYPGSAGEKKISVSTVVNGKRVEAQASLSWKPEAGILLMGLSGDRQFLMTKEQMRFAMVNLERPKAVLNGRDITLKTDGKGEIKTFSFKPEWTKGINRLIIRGTGTDGTLLEKDYSFVYSEDGTIEEGMSVTLDYGYMGSKSGPFFSVALEGNALEMTGRRDAMVYGIGQDGWLDTGDVRYLQEFRAIKPGLAKVLIYKKSHFLQPKELEKEITLTVVPKPR